MARTSNAGKKRVRFEYMGQKGDTVYVAGNFNGWDPESAPLKEQGEGLFACNKFIPQGKCEYKFVVNGKWCIDPECDQWAPNEMGSLNSVLMV